MFENGQLTVLNINDILPNRFQPRIRFDEEKLEELAESIGKYGVIQPIVVRPVGNKFEIIAGERRYKASKLANKSTIPAIIVNLSDKDSEEIALLENIQRQQLSPIEEAVSYKRILDMGYITQEQLAKKLGKSQSTIANKIRLLNLDDEVQSYLLNNKISERHARSLLRIPDKEKQVEMLHRIVDERLTVKQTDKEIEKLKEEMKVHNKPAQAITLDLSQTGNSTSIINDEKNKFSSSEEIESLFDEPEKVNPTEERRNVSMDIDKIMREAKDINVPTQEAPKDISGLMQPGNDVQSEPIVRNEEVQNSNNIEPNKFINVVPQNVQPKMEQPQPANNTVTFDSVFNQHISTPETTTNSTSFVTTPQNVTEPAKSVQSTPLIQNNDMTNESLLNPQNVNNDQNTISDDTKKIISTAVADALKRYNQSKIQKRSARLYQSIDQSQSVKPSVNTQSIEASTKTTIPTETAHEANVVTPPIKNVSVDQMASGQSSIPSTDIIADNALNEYAISSTNSAQEMSQPTMASTMTQNVKPINNQSHFAQIVKMLRDCANQIEQNGYFVNVDEMDLGKQYKVTFTIDKE